MMKKYILLITVKKNFRYNLENLSSKKNTKYHGWELSKPFQGEGLDGKQHEVGLFLIFISSLNPTYNCFQITFDFKDDTLTEKHIRLEDPADKGETYFYTIDNDSKLVLVNSVRFVFFYFFFQKFENNGIVARRWFKREEPKN